MTDNPIQSEEIKEVKDEENPQNLSSLEKEKVPKNRNLERIRSNIKNSLFNVGKSASFHVHPVEETSQSKLMHSNSTTNPTTGRAKFEKIRSSLKMNFFPNSRVGQPDSDLGVNESSQKLDFETDISKKQESSFSQDLSLESTTRDPNSENTMTPEIETKRGDTGTIDLSALSSDRDHKFPPEETKSVNNIDTVLEENEHTSEEEDDDGSEPLYDPNREGFKHSVFFHNAEDEIEELKRELNVGNDPDIHFIQGDFYNYYVEDDILGEGTTATVKKCFRQETEEVFAVKIVHYRDDLEILVLMVKEFNNHRKLEHKNIIKVYEMYIDYFTKKIYTIMELAECQEMFEVLQDLGHYSEAIASHIFKQILSAINYLHSHGVCHRDLKPNNILVSRDGSIVKITDFNVSKFIEKKGQKYSSLSTENYKMWTYTGTIAFIAPEMFIETEYTEAVDMWSAGVVLYTMLCGYQPFQAEYVHELIELIKAGKYEFHPDPWDNISDQAKDLVQHCLDVNYKTRYSSSDALIHPWISNNGKLSTSNFQKTIANIKRNASRLTITANESEGTKIIRINTGTWDSGLPTIQRKLKRSGTFKAEEEGENLPRIMKLETMHAISQLADRNRLYEDDLEDFPKEEDEEFEETPRGPQIIDMSRSESIPKSFTAYELVLNEYKPNKEEDSTN